MTTLRHTLSALLLGISVTATAAVTPQTQAPQAAVTASQQAFAADRLGIFIHWGIYSLFGQGEWYLNYGPRADEYAKAAGAFYPAAFNADEWASAIAASGARYVTFTTRHHDGFSMWHTAQSPYNITDATPYKHDILGQLAQACASHNLKLHLYYSLIDWTRDDYPWGRTGHTTGRDSTLANWPHYQQFMESQLRELLTQYGTVRCIWFDGVWDHDQDATPFDWHLGDLYDLIHSLQPGCLVGNNHHLDPFPGEDIQIFERDVPGENKAGYSGQSISRLPLETCQTMNGMWGYKVIDTDYKPSAELIRLLVSTAGRGANLLLNIGPQPDGRLPQAALERLHDLGQWMSRYGHTIYDTQGSPIGQQPWGTCTQRGNTLYLHILQRPDNGIITLPGLRARACRSLDTDDKIKLKTTKAGTTITLPQLRDIPDNILELTL